MILLEMPRNYEWTAPAEGRSKINNTLAEKYRPKTFDEIIGNREAIEALQTLAKKPKGMVPNMLLTGPVGCGKTTAAKCFISERALWKQNNPKFEWDFGGLAVYNASDDRGIETMREIKRYANCSSEIIIYLNEADRLTSDAKDALRSILENKNDAVFILDGNDETLFTPAVKSRCVPFRFNPLEATAIYHRLLYIFNTEGIEVNDDVENVARELAEQSNGDLRSAINSLEARFID
jgi:DNA polymerase III delta prime subunit